MPASRRDLLTSLFSAATLSAAGCAAPPARGPKALHIEPDALARAFAPVAARARPGKLNVGVAVLDGQGQWCADETGLYPLQSVFKAPLAAAVLALVDAGQLRLNDRVRIADEDREPWTSRLSDAVAAAPGRILDLPVADLIALAVQESDNVAADVLMRRIGGPGALTAWLVAHGVNGMRIDRYEREAQPEIAGLGAFRPEWRDRAAWIAARDSLPPAPREAAAAAYLDDSRDTSTAPAALAFLKALALGQLLKPESTALMLRLMTATSLGPHRLLAGLPPGTVLAHKTGTSATVLGITPATNDVGLVTLPDGRRFAVVALLKGSTGTEAQREALIAEGARTIVSTLG